MRHTNRKVHRINRVLMTIHSLRWHYPNQVKGSKLHFAYSQPTGVSPPIPFIHFYTHSSMFSFIVKQENLEIPRIFPK